VVPHIIDFLRSLVDSTNLMRLSSKKGAHAVWSSATCRKFRHLARFREMWDTASKKKVSLLACKGKLPSGWIPHGWLSGGEVVPGT
jgi:hypothetical protein